MPISTLIPSIRAARDLGLPYFQLIISNWGDQGVAADVTEQSFATDVPVRWLAMEAGSDFQSLLIDYPNQSPVNVVSTSLDNGIEVPRRLFMSTQHPFMDKVPAQLVLFPGLTSLFTDTYKTTGGATAPFGSALTQTGQGGTPTSQGVWVQPELRVLMGFEDPPQLFPKRAHKLYRFTRTTTAPNVEELMLVVPVFGRRHARVTLFAANGTNYNARVTAVGGTVFQPIIGAQVPILQEFSIGAPSTGAAVAGPAEVTFQLSLDQLVANYILLKGTRTAGTNLEIQVEVAD
jgi:hypothetical protein